MASDNLNENYTTVVIHVNDVNDNPPVFDRPTYETQITEEDDRNLPKRVLKVVYSTHHATSRGTCVSCFPPLSFISFARLFYPFRRVETSPPRVELCFLILLFLHVILFCFFSFFFLV